MRRTLVGKTAALLAGFLALGVMTAQGELTLTLDDGLGHSKKVVDGSADDWYLSVPGVVVWIGPLPGSIWSGVFVGLTKPAIGSPLEVQMDLSIQGAYSSGPGKLTISLNDVGVASPGMQGGVASMAAGGAENQGSIFAIGQVNGSTAVQLGPFIGTPWHGQGQGDASGLGTPFQVSQEVLIVHSGRGRSGGDIFMELKIAPVPEPSTLLAGVCLLAPLLIGVIRSLTRRA
jgi:hypothetical protein